MNIDLITAINAGKPNRADFADYLAPPAAAKPVTRQYYYIVPGCKASSTDAPDCICWHDEGTGPLHNNPVTTTEPISWRNKPQSAAQQDQIIGVLKSNLADGVMPSFSGGDPKHLINLLEAPHPAAGQHKLAMDAACGEIEILNQQLAALREDLAAIVDNRNALKERLTAAEQRNAELVGAVRSINHSKHHEVFVPGDDAPQYRQRKEWVDWVLGLCDEMSALKPTASGESKCCTVSAEDQALLDGGDYTPEELFGIDGKPSCPKCSKPTAPAASGSTCNQIREESGLPINNPCTACNNGACIDR